jgi:hypothetical protein
VRELLIALVVVFIGWLANLLRKRWTEPLIVHSRSDLPKGIRPDDVRWVLPSQHADRVLTGPLGKQECHFVNDAAGERFVLAWQEGRRR